mgnify:CR=1 FL=1
MNFIEKQIQSNIIKECTNDLNETNTSTNINNEDELNESEKKYTNNLLSHNLKRGPTCGLIVVDNFYNNPIETRNFILTQNFSVTGNYPGKRTLSYANEHLKEIIQKYSLLVSVEEHNIYGGLGSILSEVITKYDLNKKLIRMGIEDRFEHCGDYAYNLEKHGLSSESLQNRFMSILNNGNA